jgi:response regulator NasT
MDMRELRHETLDMLQAVFVLAARLDKQLPAQSAAERELVQQLLSRARLCRDRIAADEPPVEATPAPPDTAAGLPRLRVIVVEDDDAVRTFLSDVVRERCGHDVVATAANGPDMVRQILSCEPDLVIFDIHLPGMDGLTALHQVTQERPIAAVAVTGDRNLELVRRALEDNILAYLLKPVDAQQVGAAIQVAWARFNEFCQLRSEKQSLQQTLQDRKLIERAKGILMKKYRWSEATAFRSLQRTAMNRRTTMAHLAQDLLEGRPVEFVA